MWVAIEVFRVYFEPRRSARRTLSRTDSEGKAFALILAGCLVLFCAQIPDLVRMSATAGDHLPFAGLATATIFGAVLLAPLVFYATAGISGLIARFVGRSISWLHARVSLFWAVFAVSPAVLLAALLLEFSGDYAAFALVHWILLALFLMFWISGLIESANAGQIE